MTENLHIGADLYIGQEITVVTDPDVPHLKQEYTGVLKKHHVPGIGKHYSVTEEQTGRICEFTRVFSEECDPLQESPLLVVS